MSRPLKAGERLSKSESRRRGRQAPPKAAARGAPKKQRPGLAGFAGGLIVRWLYRLALLGVVGGAVVGGGLFLYFSNGLPGVDRLRHYEPPLETRIYAGNFRLIGALGTQHRIYVPYDRIPRWSRMRSSPRRTRISGPSRESTRSPSSAPAWST
ncbi:unnamed protein product [Acidocella sp. C78]|uniref:hypothetical protein n=1 Tax=Acidocella sp. C78 TaxID=1671486 RepID=UPI001BC81456|nr:hypothetical protein [Acidocella sp. C78]CAG4913077.1 unnamed protein product [Acidocella sp. C78]